MQQLQSHQTPYRPTIVAALPNFSDDDGDDDDATPGTPGPGPGSSGPSSSGATGPGPGGMLMGGMLPSGPTGSGPSGTGSPDDLESMLVNYNQKFATADPALYRDKVIDLLAAALISKNKPSAIMLGPAGVGKTRVVEELARRIAIKDSSIPTRLRKATIYELSLNSLTAGTMYRGMMEERIQKLVAWASNPDNHVILFIDEIHQLVGGEGSGHSNEEIAQALKPALARGDFSVIGATTDQEGRKLTADPALMRRFSRIGVSELNQDQTHEILEAVLPGLIAHHKGAVTADPAILTDVIALADEHLTTLHRPDSALTLLDRSLAALTVSRHSKLVSGLLPAKTPIPLNRTLLTETAQNMHGSDAVARHFDAKTLTQALTKIKGQDEICAGVVTRLRRDNAHLFPRKRPLAWMFAGSSGVGKTEVARQIAHEVMGTEPIVLNMAEFAEPYSITRITGSSPGYIGSTSNREMPFDPLDANPRQVILLDEFEKAHRDIQRLFLSVLDSGTMQMASTGKMVDFSKAIIIATTNAGRDSISKGGLSLGFSGSTGNPTSTSAMTRDDLTRILSSSKGQGGFEPELLGRFTWIVAFNSISAQTYTEILGQTYLRLREEIMLTNPMLGSELPETLDGDVAAQLCAASFVKEQGARPAEAAVREWIEDTLDPAL